ncbi:MAG: hypothetical protein P4K94_04750 [Terracidiphilus sp.]|nr:hypothetical protein [Terracidiphilus sp.]
MLAFLVSLGALLFAAAGVAHHIWLQHRQSRRKPVAGVEPAPDAALEPAEEIDHEAEH